jgi:phosphomannomutase
MNPQIQKRIQQWLEGPYDDETKQEIRHLQETQPEALIDAFYTDLSFGTGGMRSLMGIGPNRMNIYTVRVATQGLASYLQRQKPHVLRVFIGYDVRLHSRQFAEEAARVLVANGIGVLVTQEVCPTPLVSFGCRHFQCSAAIMITASHNPPQYNGYKVYWNDGAQVVAPHDRGILDCIKQISMPVQVGQVSLEDPNIQWIGDELDQAYLKALDRLILSPPQKPLRIVYTNIHGTGLRLVPRALKRRGYTQISLVNEQSSLDGTFPAAPHPNPEEEGTLELGSRQLLREQGDVLLATDPDADRVGVVVRHQERAVILNGHELACILLSYIAERLQQRGELPQHGAFIKTIVTTEMARKIALHYGIACYDVLTGFKYIAQLIREWEENQQQQFLFGAEESLGFLFRSFVRDKDGIAAACLIAEAAERMKREGKTLIDRLYELYHTYGIYRQCLVTLDFEDTPVSRDEMRRLLQRLRDHPPRTIGGVLVRQFDDYLNRTSLDIQTGKTRPLQLESSNVLLFWLQQEGKLVIRLSGTEPKIKIYGELCRTSKGILEQEVTQCDQELRALVGIFTRDVRSGEPR